MTVDVYFYAVSFFYEEKKKKKHGRIKSSIECYLKRIDLDKCRSSTIIALPLAILKLNELKIYPSKKKHTK